MNPLPTEVLGAYAAPYPDESYKAGARVWPWLVPVQPDDPGAEDNRNVWRELSHWHKPFLTLFSDGDPLTRGAEELFQERVPGARGRPHRIIADAGHFLQEDKGEEVASHLIDFMRGD